MRKRNCAVLLRLSDDELEKLDRRVARTGMSREGYIRFLINGIVPKERPSAEMFDVLKELRQINNNMNQIAAKANSTGMVEGKAYSENADALQDAINKIMGRIFS